MVLCAREILGTKLQCLCNKIKNVMIFIIELKDYYLSSNVISLDENIKSNFYKINYDDGDIVAANLKDDILYELCCIINKYALDNKLDISCAITLRENEWN